MEKIFFCLNSSSVKLREFVSSKVERAYAVCRVSCKMKKLSSYALCKPTAVGHFVKG
jgi:hypothetical protein